MYKFSLVNIFLIFSLLRLVPVYGTEESLQTDWHFNDIVVNWNNVCRGPYLIKLNEVTMEQEYFQTEYKHTISNFTENDLTIEVLGKNCSYDKLTTNYPEWIEVATKTNKNEIKVTWNSTVSQNNYIARYVKNDEIFEKGNTENFSIILKNFTNLRSPVQIQLRQDNRTKYVSKPFEIQLEAINLSGVIFYDSFNLKYTTEKYCLNRKHTVKLLEGSPQTIFLPPSNGAQNITYQGGDMLTLKVMSEDGVCISNNFTISAPNLIPFNFTRNDTSVIFEWTKAKNINRYEVFFVNAKNCRNGTVNGKSFVLNGLNENTRYNVKIQLLQDEKVTFVSSNVIMFRTYVSATIKKATYYTNGTISVIVDIPRKPNEIKNIMIHYGMDSKPFNTIQNPFIVDSNFETDLKNITVIGYISNNDEGFKLVKTLNVTLPHAKFDRYTCHRNNGLKVVIKKINFLTPNSRNTLIVATTNNPMIYSEELSKFENISFNISKETNFSFYVKSLYAEMEASSEAINVSLSDCDSIVRILIPEDDDLSYVWIILLVILFVIVVAGMLLALYYFVFRKKTISDIYQLLPLTKISANPLNPTSLDMFVREKNIVNMIELEFKSVPLNSKAKCIGQNFAKKNRYGNVLPNRESHVSLKLLPDDPSSWYINANYIKNYMMEDIYIATQCPTDDSIYDFWRMVWQNEAYIIVMLTSLVENGNVKGTRYWLDEGCEMNADGILVCLEATTVFRDYTIRTFKLTNEGFGFSKSVTQFQYTAWPDHDIPIRPNAFVDFVRLVSSQKVPNTCVVVHCSAGLNRTAVYMLVDLSWEEMKAKNLIDFPTTLGQLRKYRSCMLGELLQYKYAYCVINELINGKCTDLNLEEISKYNPLDDFQYVNENNYWLDVLGSSINPGFEMNLAKHRNINKPYRSKMGILYLDRLPGDEQSHYIVAVKINAHTICTQQPLETTEYDFWRLIYLQKTDVIVSLHTVDNPFWPIDGNDFEFANGLIVHLVTFQAHPVGNVYTLELKSCQGNLNVSLIQFFSWPIDGLPTYVTFLHYFNTYMGLKVDKRVVLACCDGAKGCGLLLTFEEVNNQLITNKVCNIAKAVQFLRYYRDDFMNEQEQYTFILEALKYHLANQKNHN